MKLWRGASGALKDQTSLWQATLTRRSALRNPEVEKAVIRATTHRASSIDRRSFDRFLHLLRQSPFNLKPTIWSVANRLDRTRSWVVALKCLHVIHAVIDSRAPSVETIGRLPFDLSGFKDGHHRQAKAWPYNAFVRAYFSFLDQKSTINFQHAEDKHEEFTMMAELVVLQKLENLINLLIQIKPVSRAASDPLILHVMNDVILEIYDIYSRFCRSMATVLMNIYSATKSEAMIVLNVVRKAKQQGHDLMYFFEHCHGIGIIDESEFPVLDHVPEEGIHELEHMVGSFSSDGSKECPCDERAIMPRCGDEGKYLSELTTIITDEWERFDEDFIREVRELPDLITFV